MNSATSLQVSRSSPWQMVICYVLLLPMLFFASGGIFSFELAKSQSGAYANSITRNQTVNDPFQRGAEVTLCLSIVLAALIRKHRIVTSGLRLIVPFLWVVVWAAGSTTWSLYPLISARNGVYLLINTLFALYLVRSFPTEKLKQVFTMCGFAFLVCNYLMAIVLPRYGVSPTDGGANWQGICVHKNVCAYMTVFLLIPVLSSKARSSLGYIARLAYICASLFLISLTHSRTGWILTAVLYFTVFVARFVRKLARRDAAVLMLVLLLPGAALVWFVFTILPSFFVMIGKDSSMNGRLPIWWAVLESIAKRPFIGYGYEAFWHSGMSGENAGVVAKVGWNPSFAHNGLLEVGLELGVIGVLLVLWTLVRALRDIKVSFRTPNALDIEWYLSIIVLTIFVNIDEGTLLNSAHLGWTLYVMACAGLTSEAEMMRGYRTENRQDGLPKTQTQWGSSPGVA